MFVEGEVLGDGAVVKLVDSKAGFIVIEKLGTSICLGLTQISRGEALLRLPVYWEPPRHS